MVDRLLDQLCDLDRRLWLVRDLALALNETTDADARVELETTIVWQLQALRKAITRAARPVQRRGWYRDNRIRAKRVRYRRSAGAKQPRAAA